MLVLVTETHVAVEISRGQQRAPKFTAIAARNAGRPVEATRRELFHAVHELRQLVAKRERELQVAKERFLEAKRVRREQKKEARDATLIQELAKTTERLAQARERERMHRADLETREFVRSLRTIEEDLRIRQRLKRQRREQEENALMVIEEYQMRYVVAESQRRELEARARLMEVSKRDQFVQERAQQQLREMEEMMRIDVEKKTQLERQRLIAREEDKVRWATLSKSAKKEAQERLHRREREEEEIRWRLEAEQNAERASLRLVERQKEELRLRKYKETKREQHERELIGEEDKNSRRWHFALKKNAAAEQWEAKREKEKNKYSLDPLQFAKMEAQKALEERQRRENNLMRDEDVISRAMKEKEKKEQYFKLCRERKRLRDIERRREVSETSLMQVEDDHSGEIRRAVRQAEEYKRTLEQMQVLADQVANKQKDRLQEARNRKLMYDEENRQRRVQQAQLQLDRIQEKHERETMEEEDKRAHNLDATEARLLEKRVREKRNWRMMREDVAAMERQDWEEEGRQLEKLLWTPNEAVALRHLVTDYPKFLSLNVEVLMEFVDTLKGPPPLDLDYEAVEAHLETEHTLTEDKIPSKKRKPRKFFYHEFFEKDPIMESIYRRRFPEPEPPTSGPGSTNELTRERWKRVAAHFLSRSWGSEASRKGFVLMHNGEYEAACKCLLEAVHSMQYTRFEDPPASTYQDVPPALLRQLGRCLLKQFQVCYQWEYLSKSLFFFQQASTHLVFLSNPLFLQEIAFALELSGDYRHAAEILGGVISCFPRYSRLMEVIFRAGIVMISLKMFRQSREYVLHTMDASPFGWESVDIVFLAARIMELEGKSSRSLCAVAYEDAYRKNLRGSLHHVHATWQEWIKAAETWCELGDRYLERQEFVLAKDAYLVMRKRQTHKPSHLTSKRKAVMAALHRQQTHIDVSVSMFDDRDWMRISCAFAMLNDRPTTVTAMSNWLTAGGGYRSRVTERFYRWPLVRWKFLTGAPVPQKVTQWLDDQKKAKVEAEAQIRLDKEAKRKELLRERQDRSYLGMQAWEQQEESTQISDKLIDQDNTFVTTEEPGAGVTEEDGAISVTGATDSGELAMEVKEDGMIVTGATDDEII
ncbi:General transcriptional corepressor trfA [Phytophthora citrophthora]|uniref:General transcriptional corepressor trfA n=1 Tax=Phytophthora citrophthora TaxID=4793 RepID=A0AAD9H0M0_9STRA|nr:General transcriptional corepressor trfA [Phytophthora citrophthora]